MKTCWLAAGTGLKLAWISCSNDGWEIRVGHLIYTLQCEPRHVQLDHMNLLKGRYLSQ